MGIRGRFVCCFKVPFQNNVSLRQTLRSHNTASRSERSSGPSANPSTSPSIKKSYSFHPLPLRDGSRSNSTANLMLGMENKRAVSGSPRKSWDSISLWQTGARRPQPVEISDETRTIRGEEKVVQSLRKSLASTVPEIWTTLDDRGNHQLHWPAGTDAAVKRYLELYRGTTENKYLYEGAFATGVRRVKMASLGLLAVSAVGGPMLIASSVSVFQTFAGGLLMVAGAAVSGVVHVVATPYVLSLRRLTDGSFEADTALATGAIQTTHFNRQEVMLSSRPFCTFTAKGHRFYVHRELFVGDDAQAMLCDLLGDQAAEEMYEAQLRKNPSDLDALYNYGRFLWKVRGDLEAAEGAFAKILAEDPSDREVLTVLKAVQNLRQSSSPPAAPAATAAASSSAETPPSAAAAAAAA